MNAKTENKKLHYRFYEVQFELSVVGHH